ncbi:MAG: DNA gyrase subunit A [Candidatus Aminicenantia bacterium]
MKMEERVERSVQVSLEDEMKRSYLDYAMSVIIGRALPDAFDGLKPVHRRILWAMWESNSTWDKPFKKSARIVGDVIGKYHPHGDAAVYDAIVRMAQDFTMRYPLIEGQGNFGSVDGDPPAAMRYTEVRLEKLSRELLEELEKNTVPFTPNYDNTLKEPVYLPARFPGLLINGSAGIAVGMATNVPPHNFNEVVDALVYMIDKPDANVDELMQFIKGPDFPTGAFIIGKEGIKEAYEKGKGLITIRAKAFIEKIKSGRENIVISEIPYQVSKAKILEKIGELMRGKGLEGVSEVRDESDRDGIRVVVELKKDAFPQVILNYLYKHTALQTTFGIIFLAVTDNQPKLFTLPELLQHFLIRRKEIVRRRIIFDREKAEARVHILQGLIICINNIEKVVEIIKKSKNAEEAGQALMKNFHLTKIQAQAILDMQLSRLTNLEREKIVKEEEELRKEIERLKKILEDERLIMNLIKEELLKLKEIYGDKRKTEILEHEEKEIRLEDTIPEEDYVIIYTSSGYVKRTHLSAYRHQGRGGKGKIGMKVKEEDEVAEVFIASSHSYLLLLTDKGRLYWLKVLEIPDVGTAGRGKHISNLLKLREDEIVKSVVSVRELEKEDSYLLMITKKGFIKKTHISAFRNPRSTGTTAIGIEDDDSLLSCIKTDGGMDIIIGTANGIVLRFNEKDVRDMGRSARGVGSMRLKKDDGIVGMEAVSEEHKYLFTVTERGYGKKTLMEKYRVQRRGGIGIINIKVTEKTGKVCGLTSISDYDDIIIATNYGKVIKIKTDTIRQMGRYAQGVRLISLEEGDSVASFTPVTNQS